MYTPTMRGLHQLSIKIKNTEIKGSPFMVNVLPKAASGVVQRTITDLEKPRDVAVSKNGDVVVCHDWGTCSHISVFSRKGKKILSLRTNAKHYSCVAITADNHIHAVSTERSQIDKYTMEGKHENTVDWSTSLEFHQPSSIAVHSTGKVVVAGGEYKPCIMVLNHDLKQSDLFSIHSDGNAAGEFRLPHVACGSDGVVYVAGKRCIRSYNIDGQCISKDFFSFNNPGTSISSICIDSTNILYVSDRGNNGVSVLGSRGKLLKNLCFNGNKQQEWKSFVGIAIDNTTGALYVCDWYNGVVVY